MTNNRKYLFVIAVALSIVSLPSYSVSCTDSDNCPSILNEIESLAERRAPEAQLLMGLLYQRGEYFAKDSQQSFLWYKRAALTQRSFSLAQHLVGRAYLFGDGVEPNLRRAVKYLKRSAKSGLVDSQRLLGQEYGSGEILEKDIVLAQFWLRKAYQQNDYRSTVRLAELLSNTGNDAKLAEAKLLTEASKKMPINNKEITQTIEVGPQLFSSIIQRSNLWLEGKISSKIVCRSAERDRNNNCFTFVGIDNFRKQNPWPHKKPSNKYYSKH